MITTTRRRRVCLILYLQARASAEFEPYQLNGGLVTAIAAKDYVVIASDTRFSGEGAYDIVSRDHVSSRLWMAGEVSGLLSSPKKEESTNYQVASFVRSHAPAFVGSVGCNADCEQLKRVLQMEVRSATYFGECHAHPPVDQIATLVGQVLYGRRTFPYYAFCVVAGMDDQQGQVFVYDAIGSYERVAVASSGTGRELLQPILDRTFRTLVPTQGETLATTVPTLVDCEPEEAVSKLVEAYRSVSEREIGVGDNVVVCVARRQEPGGKVECNVYKYPLKQH